MLLWIVRFRDFGKVRYARITMDADTGRSRGTGFVSFWEVDDAKTCIEEAERMRSDLDPEVCSLLAAVILGPNISDSNPSAAQHRSMPRKIHSLF